MEEITGALSKTAASPQVRTTATATMAKATAAVLSHCPSYQQRDDLGSLLFMLELWKKCGRSILGHEVWHGVKKFLKGQY